MRTCVSLESGWLRAYFILSENKDYRVRVLVHVCTGKCIILIISIFHDDFFIQYSLLQ